MKSQNEIHLNEKLISLAVIDEEVLDRDERQHLMTCLICNTKVKQIKDELQQFGENVYSAVPPSKKNVILPVEELAPASHKSSWLPTFGAAAMAGLVLFFYFLGMESMSPRLTLYQSADVLMEDEFLMEEISEMVENPLSESLYEITGNNGGFDEDFFEFMVPDIQEDFQSKYFIQGGIKQC